MAKNAVEVESIRTRLYCCLLQGVQIYSSTAVWIDSTETAYLATVQT